MRDTPLTRFLSEQTVGQLREIRTEFRAEIESGRRRLQELENDLAVVEEAIAAKSGSRTRQPRPTVDNGPAELSPSPTLRRTVAAFIGDRPGGWTRDEIMDELARRGAEPKGRNPSNTLITRLREMVQRGELEKFGDMYRAGPKIAPSKGDDAQSSLPVPGRDTRGPNEGGDL